MKKSFVLILLIVCSFFYTSAQLDGLHWVERDAYLNLSAPNNEDVVIENFKVEGDTMLYGINYKKVYYLRNYDNYFSDPRVNDINWSYYCSIREDENLQIYMRDYLSSANEVLLYDFSKWEIGDTLFCGEKGLYRTMAIVTDNNLDSVQLLNGNYHQTIRSNIFGTLMIRGIGDTHGFFWTNIKYARISSTFHGIIQYYNREQLLWENPNYVGLEEHGKEDLVKTYSVNSSLYFDMPMTFNQLELYSLDGRLMYLFSNLGITTHRIGPLPNGVYLYKVMYANGSSISRGKVMVR